MSIDHFDPVEVPLELHQRLSWFDELNPLAGSLDCLQLTPLLKVLRHFDHVGLSFFGSEISLIGEAGNLPWRIRCL